MDYDADGILDMISGSYDPGDVYLFRGLGQGKYAGVEQILDATGTPLVHHPEELKKYERMREDPEADPEESIQARVASFGSWPAPVDWDDDGDLDMLIGTFRGTLYRRLNTGSREKPVIAAESIAVEADGKALSVFGHCDPVPADWDGDGLWDLVVGASDGSVSWYKNIGTRKEPAFGPQRILIEAKAKSKFLTQYLEPSQPTSPGVRAQICVTDYDGDGRLDLLVGDYSHIWPLRELNAAERQEFDALVLKGEELSARLNESTKAEQHAALETELTALREAKKRYQAPDSNDKERPPASFVWLFRRQSLTREE